MYRIIILFVANHISAVKLMQNGKMENISIEGNISLLVQDMKSIDKFFHCLLDRFSIDTLRELDMDVTVIYSDIEHGNLLYLLEKLSESKTMKILSFADALIFTLLKKDVMRMGESITIRCHENTYVAICNEEYKIIVDKVESAETSIRDITITCEDFDSINEPQITALRNTTQTEEIQMVRQGYEEQINGINQELEDKCQEVKLLLNNYESVQKEYSSLTDALIQTLADKRRKVNRYIYRLKPLETNKNSWFLGNSYGTKLRFESKVKHMIGNGDCVKKGEKLIKINFFNNGKQFEVDDYYIIAESPGRVFLLCENNMVVKEGDPLLVIGNKEDVREDIIIWLNNITGRGREHDLPRV